MMLMLCLCCYVLKQEKNWNMIYCERTYLKMNMQLL